MKKIYIPIIAISFLISSCATVLGGSITEKQTTKPKAGEPKRKIRPGLFIADLILMPVVGFIVDFSTGAIYQK